MSAPEPNLYAFLDYRTWLEAWIAWKKSIKPSYSYTILARRAGLGRATVRNIVRRRRHASAKTVHLLVSELFEDEEKRRYFRLLVKLASPRLSESQRSEVLDRIFAHEGYAWARPISELHRQYLARWHYVVIREMVRLPRFREDPTWIADELHGRITPDDARQALHDLELAGLLRRTGGHLEAVDVRLDSGTEVDAPYRENHLAMLGEAAAALEYASWEERFFGAATLVVTDEQLAMLRSECTAFIRQLMNRVEAEQAAGTRVVQMNVQMFPFTRPDAG